MRLRLERRIRKRLRLAHNRELARTIAEYERQNLGLIVALTRVVSAIGQESWAFSDAGRLLNLAKHGTAIRLLLERFMTSEGADEIWDAACGIEHLGDTSRMEAICVALRDANLVRRRAAAHILGWLHGPRERVVSSLIDVVSDRAQPAEVRGQAAESLRYIGSRRAVPALLAILKDPDAEVRWWATFALGSAFNRFDNQVVSALEMLVDDEAIPEGQRYSVGHEALGVLGSMDPPGTDYRERMETRTKLINDHPEAASERDRHWAATWGDPAP